MKRVVHLVVALAVAATGVALISHPATAQVPMVTITFKLTINGTPPRTDGFEVRFGETGFQLCDPCLGGGHTYVQATPWPKGTAFIHFRFTRVTTSASVPRTIVHVQDFGQQPISASSDTTVRGFFAYAAAPQLQVPATGTAAAFPTGGALIGGGAALLLLGIRRCRWSRIPRSMR